MGGYAVKCKQEGFLLGCLNVSYNGDDTPTL